VPSEATELAVAVAHSKSLENLDLSGLVHAELSQPQPALPTFASFGAEPPLTLPPTATSEKAAQAA
jgi:hypothetical protein